MSEHPEGRDAVIAYNYVNTEGAITGPTIRSTWRIFHEREFWDEWCSCENS